MKKFWMATVAAILALGLLAGCPDDDTCTECWCDPVYCTDGGDADADADGDVAVEYGNLTVRATAAGVEVNADIELDGSPTGYQTPHTFENLPLDTHDILLSYPGRIQGPSPMEVDVPPEGTEVNIFLYHDLTGSRWHRNDGMDRDFSMQISPPDYRCPDTWVRVINVSPVGTLCLEIDDTLSLCKTRASECGGDWVEGTISSDGRRIEFTHHWETPTPGEQTFVYTKID